MATRKGQEDTTLNAPPEGDVFGLSMVTLHESVSALNHVSGMVCPKLCCKWFSVRNKQAQRSGGECKWMLGSD